METTMTKTATKIDRTNEPALEVLLVNGNPTLRCKWSRHVDSRLARAKVLRLAATLEELTERLGHNWFVNVPHSVEYIDRNWQGCNLMIEIVRDAEQDPGLMALRCIQSHVNQFGV